VFIGREPSNDVVLTDDTVSDRHASVWVHGSDVWLEDLRSADGTRVNGGRVTEPMKVKVGDVIELGRARKRLQVAAESDAAPTPATDASPFPAVVALRTGTRTAIERDRFRIAGDPGADIVVAAQPDEAVTILAYPDGEIWLGRGDICDELEDGEEFSVGAHRFRIAFNASGRDTTRHVKPTASRYVLRAALHGPAGAEATLTDEASGRTHAIRGEQRATLVYVLAKKLVQDIDADVPSELAGWCTHDEVVAAVWGRSAADHDLEALLPRIRNELKLAGLDPWCVEQRRGHVRVRARKAVVD
jgi:predicted component of type VI protein secretion system